MKGRSCWRARSAMLGALLTLAPAGHGRAAVWYVHATAGGAANGTSWADAFPSLAQALAQAAGGEALWVAAGTYQPAPPGAANTNRFQIRNGLRLYGGFLPGMSAESQRDPFRNRCTLSGDLNGDDTPGRGNRGDNAASVLHVNGATNLVIDGFTIRGGEGTTLGAGLFVAHTAEFLVTRCTFTDNAISSVSGLGAGMWCDPGSFGIVRQCVFAGNYSAFRAAGFGIDGYTAPHAGVALVNCTVTGNAAVGEGDGVYARADTVPVLTIRNCILWANNDQKADTNAIQNIRERGNAQVLVSYSDYDRNKCSGTDIVDTGGHLTEDPLFADPATGDFHLLSAAGRTTPAGRVVYDLVTSACVDAGDPADPCEEEPQAEPCRVDMGAYGGTRQASGDRGAEPAGVQVIVR